jgi:hypothetical protein
LRRPDDGRQRRALAAVVEHLGAAGLDVEGAGIWRAGSAVLVGLPAVPALARVDEPARAGDARRQVDVATVLGRAGVPAVSVVGPAGQPIATRAGPLTVWRWVPPTGVPVGPGGIARLARVLHDRTRGLGRPGAAPAGVPVHEPLVAVRFELDRAEGVGATTPADLGTLRRAGADLGARWPAPDDDPLGAAVVHGDLHRHNVVPGPDGPVLADLELAGWGPASVDLAPQVVAIRRYGADPSLLDEVVAGYGADPRRWSAFEVLVDTYELWVTAWAVANRTASPGAEREAEVRLQRWRTGTSSTWSLR